MLRSRGNPNLYTTANRTVLKVIVRNRVGGTSLKERLYPGDGTVESAVDRKRRELRTEDVIDQRDW